MRTRTPDERWWIAGTVFPDTLRTVRLHRSPGVLPDRPAALVVFQDGALYADPAGPIRGAAVLDRLVEEGAMPPVVGVFVDAAAGRRNLEYDAADDRYAAFLLEDVLPQVAAVQAVTDDPAHRAVVGGSSGGNCAFTVAWHRPDAFGGVVSLVGSFAQMPGGNPYPALLAAGARAPTRVVLQADRHDLGAGRADRNWYAENLELAAALGRAGRDHRLVLTEGGHSPVPGGRILPEALRWLWREGAAEV